MKRTFVLIGMLAAATLFAAPLSPATAGDLFYGCLSRPACGKVCKLICETKTLTATGYGCECKAICIPNPSCRGCQHCETKCCSDTPAAQKGCPPKLEFCWYDWCSGGCACPREVRVLTKFQGEHKICWYHWEVVDGCTCCAGGPENDGVFKPAPGEAQIGQSQALSSGEQVELASWMESDAAKKNATLADVFNVPELATTNTPAAEPVKATVAEEKHNMLTRFSSLFKSGK